MYFVVKNCDRAFISTTLHSGQRNIYNKIAAKMKLFPPGNCTSHYKVETGRRRKFLARISLTSREGREGRWHVYLSQVSWPTLQLELQPSKKIDKKQEAIYLIISI